jgi:hypothetical protein
MAGGGRREHKVYALLHVGTTPNPLLRWGNESRYRIEVTGGEGEPSGYGEFSISEYECLLAKNAGTVPAYSTSKITNHHSTIINQNQPHLIFLLSTLSHRLSGASGSPPSGLKPNSREQA